MQLSKAGGFDRQKNAFWKSQFMRQENLLRRDVRVSWPRKRKPRMLSAKRCSRPFSMLEMIFKATALRRQ
jgi:hypothetical protein